MRERGPSPSVTSAGLLCLFEVINEFAFDLFYLLVLVLSGRFSAIGYFADCLCIDDRAFYAPWSEMSVVILRCVGGSYEK